MEERANDIQIRPYESRDLAKVQALHARASPCQPYRPEDQAEVQAMVVRAAEAERTGDRWVPLADAPDRLDAIEASYAAFWVAVSVAGPTSYDVVGMVGVRPCTGDSAELSSLPLAREWQRRGDVAELRRLRVAPEFWRRGIGARLSETVIYWSRENGYRSLVLNTTSPQAPAQALYRRLGFQEVGRSFIGTYELVWFELYL